MASPLKKNEYIVQPVLDPLYVIFEQHLYNFPEADVDRKTFIIQIVNDYLTHLRRQKISIPRSLEQSIVEELAAQVNTMLVKKIYGCLTIEEFRKTIAGDIKKRAKTQYLKLRKTP